MTVYLVIYDGLNNYREIKKVYSSMAKAEEYIVNNRGFHSEIHSYEIYEMEIDE